MPHPKVSKGAIKRRLGQGQKAGVMLKGNSSKQYPGLKKTYR